MKPVILDRPSKDFSKQLHSHSADERYPWTGQWELTCRCNLKCVMCYTDCFNTPERIRQELSTSEIFRILDEIHDAGCIELTFTGGEPLSRTDFMAIYEYAHRLGFFITLFTNGTLITEEIVDRLAQSPPNSVEISLHGISSGVFDGVTQVSGSLKRCLEGIQMLLVRKIPVVLKTVGLLRNQEEILAVKRFAESLGSGVIWRFGQYLRDDLDESGSPFQYQIPEEVLQEIEKQDETLWKAKRKEIEESESMTKACGGGKMKFHIDAYGGLQLCSNNRRVSYDLRKGSFRQGFYELLPKFPCRRATSFSHEPCSHEAVSCECKCEA